MFGGPPFLWNSLPLAEPYSAVVVDRFLGQPVVVVDRFF